MHGNKLKDALKGAYRSTRALDKVIELNGGLIKFDDAFNYLYGELIRLLNVKEGHREGLRAYYNKGDFVSDE